MLCFLFSTIKPRFSDVAFRSDCCLKVFSWSDVFDWHNNVVQTRICVTKKEKETKSWFHFSPQNIDSYGMTYRNWKCFMLKWSVQLKLIRQLEISHIEKYDRNNFFSAYSVTNMLAELICVDLDLRFEYLPSY